MQVKRRINQFFDNIRRKDKAQVEDEPSGQGRNKKKWKSRKNSQNYSQWDLIENIGNDPVQEDEALNGIFLIQPNEQAPPKNGQWNEKENLIIEAGNEEESKKRKSFLRRSSSLLRRSIRRSKKPRANQDQEDPVDKDDLAGIVQEINKTLAEVATFGESSLSSGENRTPEQKQNTASENFNIKIVEVQLHNHVASPEYYHDEVDPKAGKFTLRRGLQRQASKLISKFHRSPGSLRLKSKSIESFPNATFPSLGKRGRSSSLNEINTMDSPEHKPTKAGSFRRKMSFKKAKKAMTKGVTSLGRNMAHASAVMPVAYEYPPVNMYPDYEANYEAEVEKLYYRTQAYQPTKWNDPLNLQYTHKPASYYQHGFCYNC